MHMSLFSKLIFWPFSSYSNRGFPLTFPTHSSPSRRFMQSLLPDGVLSRASLLRLDKACQVAFGVPVVLSLWSASSPFAK